MTSDLHFDPQGCLTPPEEIDALCERMASEGLDAVVLAGDLGVDLASFEECVGRFSRLGVPVGVLAGNHDVWRDEGAGLSSERLFFEALPEATARAGGLWLERERLEVGGVAVVGSLAWYDYSAVDPSIVATAAEIAATKPLLNNDAHRIDWQRDDPGFAAELGEGLIARLNEASASAVVVVTHVPVLEEQMVRKPHDPRWGLSNAYFGNLTLGHRVLSEPRVRAVVSGHAHIGRDREVKRAALPALRAAVVASDYGAPSHLVIEVG